MMCTLKDTLGGGGGGGDNDGVRQWWKRGAVRRAGRVPDVQLPSAAAAALPTAGP